MPDLRQKDLDRLAELLRRALEGQVEVAELILTVAEGVDDNDRSEIRMAAVRELYDRERRKHRLRAARPGV